VQAEENECTRKSEDRRAWKGGEAAVTSLLVSLYLTQVWPCKTPHLKHTHEKLLT